MTDDNFEDGGVDEDSPDGDTLDDTVGEYVDIDPGIHAELESSIEPGIDHAVPLPATWTRPASTGVPSVDAAIEDLARLDALPTSEHVAVYDGLHRQLQDALADLDGA